LSNTGQITPKTIVAISAEVDDRLGEIRQQRQPADRDADRDSGQAGRGPAAEHAAKAWQQVGDRVRVEPQVAGRAGEPLPVHGRDDGGRWQEIWAGRRLGAELPAPDRGDYHPKPRHQDDRALHPLPPEAATSA
jgi:hypothetical protein